MPSIKKTRRGVIGASVLAGVLAVGGYALTDTLVTPTNSHAGDGTNAVENLTASSVHYALNALDPSKIDAITFVLKDTATATNTVAAGGAVYVQPDGATWYTCDITGAPNVSCDTTGSGGLAASAVTQVRVVAAD